MNENEINEKAKKLVDSALSEYSAPQGGTGYPALQALIDGIWDGDVRLQELVAGGATVQDLAAADKLAADLKLVSLPFNEDPEWPAVFNHPNYTALKNVLDKAGDDLELPSKSQRR